MKVTKDTTIGEVLEAKPELEEVLRKHMGEVGCLSCPMRAMETLENGAQVHGVKEEDLKKMIKELNDKL